MLMVAPSGRTNEATSSDTPRFRSAARIVTGSVAALDDVENATSCAWETPRKNVTGPIRVKSASRVG